MGNITSEYDLEQYCGRHQNCDCNCMMCPAFVSLHRYELGIDEEEDFEDNDND